MQFRMTPIIWRTDKLSVVYTECAGGEVIEFMFFGKDGHMGWWQRRLDTDQEELAKKIARRIEDEAKDEDHADVIFEEMAFPDRNRFKNMTCEELLALDLNAVRRDEGAEAMFNAAEALAAQREKVASVALFRP